MLGVKVLVSGTGACVCIALARRRLGLVCLARRGSLVNNCAHSMDRFANLWRGAARSFVNMSCRSELLALHLRMLFSNKFYLEV